MYSAASLTEIHSGKESSLKQASELTYCTLNRLIWRFSLPRKHANALEGLYREFIEE